MLSLLELTLTLILTLLFTLTLEATFACKRENFFEDFALSGVGG